jgi:hypothetical protein
MSSTVANKMSDSPVLAQLNERDQALYAELFPQFKYFGKVVLVHGQLVKQALINAVHKKYARSFDSFTDLELFMDELYAHVDVDMRFESIDSDTTVDEYHCDEHCCALYPVTFMNYLYIRDGQECERHVQVTFNFNGLFALVDIEDEYWEGFMEFDKTVLGN